MCHILQHHEPDGARVTSETRSIRSFVEAAPRRVGRRYFGKATATLTGRAASRNNQALIQKDKLASGQSRLDLLIGRQTKRAEMLRRVADGRNSRRLELYRLTRRLHEKRGLARSSPEEAYMAAETLASCATWLRSWRNGAERGRIRGDYDESAQNLKETARGEKTRAWPRSGKGSQGYPAVARPVITL